MKFPLSSTLVPLLLAIALLSFASCTTILKADFERDAIGAAPDTHLPGEPTGDAMQVPAVVAPALKVISESIAGTKALEFTNIDLSAVSGHGRWFTFKAKEVNLNKPITYSWMAKAVSNFSGGKVFADCSLTSTTSDYAVPVVRLKIDNAGLLTATAYSFTDPQGITYEVGNIGSPNNSHLVIVTLNINTGKFTVTLSRNGMSGLPSVTRDILVPASAFNAAHNTPTLSFTFVDGFNPAKKYIVDDVIISRGND